MKQGRFISFEGVDGCGKSTQLAMAGAWLGEQGLEVVMTREPGDTPLGAEIRKLLLDGRFVPCAESELLLFLADRAQHVRELVRPALQRGAWVLCDRYSDSTLAYQLAARRLATDGSALRELLELAECGLKPEMTLWFDVPLDIAAGRMRMRQQAGETSTRLDDEAADFHRRVADAFAARHRDEPERVIRIDATADIGDVHDRVRATLAGRWPELER